MVTDIHDTDIDRVSRRQVLMVAWTAEAVAFALSLPHTYLRTYPRGQAVERKGQVFPAW